MLYSTLSAILRAKNTCKGRLMMYVYYYNVFNPFSTVEGYLYAHTSAHPPSVLYCKWMLSIFVIIIFVYTLDSYKCAAVGFFPQNAGK